MTFNDDRFASCDEHLADFLAEVIPDRSVREAKITNVATPDERYVCKCRRPATWFVRLPKEGT